MRLLQWLDGEGRRRLGWIDGTTEREDLVVLDEATTTLREAQAAITAGLGLAEHLRRQPGRSGDYAATIASAQLLPPVDHPDPARCWLTGTGLTHLGSAAPRDAMHGGGEVTDTMKLFRLGLAGGKPAPGTEGVQPEWFFKGDGSCLVAPGGELPVPGFSLDAGEEPEIVGCYLVGDDGRVHRLGFALGNELSDHVMERQNYLYLAHSKLRPCSIGPELLLGELPDEVHGSSRIHREDVVLWERPFLSGEAHMAHSLANLEHHHFKYPLFRQAGHLHCHFFGTATLSVADGIRTRPGDRFEIHAPLFGAPLSNRLGRLATPVPEVHPL